MKKHSDQYVCISEQVNLINKCRLNEWLLLGIIEIEC